MGAVWMQLRAEARARWRAWLGLAIVLALMGGGAIAAAAGARRTTSAYPRFLERFVSEDVGLSYLSVRDGTDALDAIGRIPGAKMTSLITGFNGAITMPSGRTVAFPSVLPLVVVEQAAGEPSGAKVLEGRMFDANAADEVVANYAFAERYGIAPGDRVRVALYSGFGAGKVEDPRKLTAEVTGIIAAMSTFENADAYGFPNSIVFGPGFHRAYPPPENFEIGVGVDLREGESGIPGLVAELRRRGLEPDNGYTPASDFTPGVQKLNRIPATALWLLGGILGLLVLAVLGQAIVREAEASRADRDALRALGVTRAQRFLSLMGGASVIVVAGALLASIVAILLSPLMPAGLARVAEPDPGLSADWVAIGAGVAAIVVLLGITLMIPVWRAAGIRARRDAEGRSILAEALAHASASPSMVSGVRMALAPGRAAGSVPVRTAMFGSTIALAALVTALVFVGSLTRLTSDPALSGYVHDAVVVPNGFTPAEFLAGRARVERDVRSLLFVDQVWRGTFFSELCVDGPARTDHLIASLVSDGPPAAVIAGRAPLAPDEIALQPATLRIIGARIGGTVTVKRSGAEMLDCEGSGLPYRVVGTVAVPTSPFVGTNTGQGVALTLAAARKLDDDAQLEAVYMTFKPDADFTASVVALEERVGGYAFAVVTREQATSVRNVRRLRDLPPVLAGFVGILGAATLIHALVTTTRRRRRDLAVLKTLGFVGRQLRATVAWQATTLIGVALLVGVPLGVVAGRWAWRTFAASLGVVPLPIVRAMLVPAVIAGALALANLIAALPARAAARTQAAVVLRTE